MKMHPKFIEAYEYLTPREQLIVDSIVLELVEKDKRISELSKHILEKLEQKEGESDAN